MRFTVDAKGFSAAMAIAGRVIPTKTPWPVMTNILIKAEGESITLSGTNGDITYEADVPAQVADPGEAALPFATLAKFFSAAKGDGLEVDISDIKATVKCGRGRIVLSATDAAEFPRFQPQSGDPIQMDAATFGQALRFCAAAVTPSEVRYHIAGVNIAEADGWIDVWGTDSKMAHNAKIVGLSRVGGGGQLPIDAVTIISGIIEKVSAVGFSVCETGWRVDAGSVRAWGKVIDSKYPDLNRILDRFRDVAWFANVDSVELLSCISVAECGAEAGSDRTRHIAMRSGGGLSVRGFKPGAQTISAGRADVLAEVTGETSLAVNAEHIRNTLGVIGESVRMGVARAIDGEVIHVEPSQASATLPMAAVIFTYKASEAELADV